jgi:hypothetical protein
MVDVKDTAGYAVRYRYEPGLYLYLCITEDEPPRFGWADKEKDATTWARKADSYYALHAMRFFLGLKRAQRVTTILVNNPLDPPRLR